MKQLSVLVLDDELRMRDEIEEFLSGKNFLIYKAGAPGLAFEILEKTSIDILILDVKLPEMDGLEVLKKVKQSYPDIEVIMISGHGDMDTVIEAMRHGAVDYLRKPFGPLDIQLAIERTEKYISLNSELRTTQNKLQVLRNQQSLISRELESKIEKEFLCDVDIRMPDNELGKKAMPGKPEIKVEK